MGPWSYAKHLVSGPRLPFTAAYFGSIALTLYFAIGVRTSFFLSWLLSIIFNIQNASTPPFTPLSSVARHYPRLVARHHRGKEGILHLQRSILQYDVTWLVTPALPN